MKTKRQRMVQKKQKRDCVALEKQCPGINLYFTYPTYYKCGLKLKSLRDFLILTD